MTLIATVARAFYDDDAVILIDVLIRDKFLRDDDMAPRLQLPAKKLRETLRFLQDEHLVKEELVDDLARAALAEKKPINRQHEKCVFEIYFHVEVK